LARVSAEQPAIALPVQLWQPFVSEQVTFFVSVSDCPLQVPVHFRSPVADPAAALDAVKVSAVLVPNVGPGVTIQPAGAEPPSQVQLQVPPLGVPELVVME
jgi:hypothetical protein